MSTWPQIKKKKKLNNYRPLCITCFEPVMIIFQLSLYCLQDIWSHPNIKISLPCNAWICLFLKYMHQESQFVHNMKKRRKKDKTKQILRQNEINGKFMKYTCIKRQKLWFLSIQSFEHLNWQNWQWKKIFFSFLMINWINERIKMGVSKITVFCFLPLPRTNSLARLCLVN